MRLEGREEVHVEVVGVEKAETGCSRPEAWGSLERTRIASLAFTDLDRLLTDPSDPTFFFFLFSTNLSQFGTSFIHSSCTSPSPLPAPERGKKVEFPEDLLGSREAIVLKWDPHFGL